jgi:hypothetical protein
MQPRLLSLKPFQLHISTSAFDYGGSYRHYNFV